jgi:hypothetical protein
VGTRKENINRPSLTPNVTTGNNGSNAPDAELLRVNDWGPKGMWILCAIMGVVGFSNIVDWLAKGHAAGLVYGSGIFLFALFCGRGAMVGLLMGERGIKVRTLFRDYCWNWTDIESFELRGTVYTPSLRVHLRNGKTKGVVGLAARTPKEKVRAQEIVSELNRRLALGHA